MTTARDALIEAGADALSDNWTDGGDGTNQELAAAVIDAVEPEIAKVAREAALREATREVQALSVKAKVGYSDATWVRLDHVTGLLRRKIAAATAPGDTAP